MINTSFERRVANVCLRSLRRSRRRFLALRRTLRWVGMHRINARSPGFTPHTCLPELAVIVPNSSRGLARFTDAYGYIAEARRLAVSVKDKCLTAQFDESRAQVLIAQRKCDEAESVIRGAVRVLEKSGQQCLLAEALTTYGIALARLGKTEQAQFTFQRAMEVAHQVGALNKAGLAALTLIEEIADLPPDVSNLAYDRAIEWLATSQSQEVLQRVIAITKKLRANSNIEPDAEGSN